MNLSPTSTVHDNGVTDKDKQKSPAPASAGFATKTTATVQSEGGDEKDKDTVEATYDAKVALLNSCLQNEIGMGRYQWQLFMLCGFGWFADNIWLQGVAIILAPVGFEFGQTEHVAFMTLALYAGLIVGAGFWGICSDVIGRKVSFNSTMAIAGVAGIAAGAAPSFASLGFFLALIGFGVGGALPVDGAIFLEFIPQSHQYLLTLLSMFWSLGQLFASLIAWAFIANYTCPEGAAGGVCPKSENWGWRYTFFTLGASTTSIFVIRFFLFNLQESPKFLLAKGRDEDAIKALQYVAGKNGKTIRLTIEDLRAVEIDEHVSADEVKMTTWVLIKRAISGVSLSHVKPLFVGSRLAINTSITILLWGLIGLAYPLYNAFLPIYLARVSASIGASSVSQTYRDYAIISIMGIPGSVIACLLVDMQSSSKTGKKSIWSRFGGRKFAMASATALTGVFLFLFTTARTNAASLGWNMATGLTQNIMYGVLYAYTPEVFPAPHRGTGDAICSSFNRLTGLMAPIIKTYSSGASPNTPIFVSASLFIISSILMMLLPIETAGVAAQ